MSFQTVPANDRISGPYAANAGQDQFNFDFPAYQSSEIAVQIISNGTRSFLVLGLDYNLTLNTNGNGGIVTLLLASAVGDVITIFGTTSTGRETAFDPRGDFTATEVNRQLNRLHMLAQEAARDLQSTLRFSPGITASPLANNPTLEDRYIGISAAGDEVIFLAGNAIDGLTGQVTSIEELRGVTKQQLRSAVLVSDPLRGGLFIWRTGDFGALASADTIGLEYVTSATTPSSVGIWQRYFDGPILARWADLPPSPAQSAATDLIVRNLIQYCAQRRYPIDFTGMIITPYTAQSYAPTGAKWHYNWSNLTWVNLVGANNQALIKIDAPKPAAHLTTVTSDQVAGRYTFNVASPVALSSGQRILIITGSTIREAFNSLASHVSQWAIVKRVDGNVVTLWESLQFNLDMTAGPIVIYDASRPTEVTHDNVAFTGPVNLSGGGVHLGVHYCQVNKSCMHHEYASTTGVYYEWCGFNEAVSLTYHKITFGYPLAFYGCDQPKFDRVSGDFSRHVISFGEGEAIAIGAPVNGNRTVMGWDLSGGDISGYGLTNSVFDTHQGHRSGHIRSIMGRTNPDLSGYPGTIEGGQTTDAVTMESGGVWRFDHIDVSGCYAGFSVQYYSGPPGAMMTSYSIGHLKIDGTFDSVLGLSLENRDMLSVYERFAVSIQRYDFANCAPIKLDCDNETNGGGIDLHIGSMSGVQTVARNAIETSCSPQGTINIHIDYADIDCQSPNGSHMTVACYGGTFTAANPTVPGVRCYIGNGYIRRTGASPVGAVLTRAYDAVNIFGPGVQFIKKEATALAVQNSGIGQSLRVSTSVQGA